MRKYVYIEDGKYIVNEYLDEYNDCWIRMHTDDIYKAYIGDYPDEFDDCEPIEVDVQITIKEE